MSKFVGETHIIEVISLAADMNDTATVTDSIDTTTAKDGVISFFVNGVSGSHGTHVVSLQYSADDSTWYSSTTNTVTGNGHIDARSPSAGRYVRLKVTTAEGLISTADLYLNVR